MAFKDAHTQFQMIDVASVVPNPASPRQQINEAALKSLSVSIAKMGLIHPLLVQPADAEGRHTLIVGERRWRAAVMAGERTVPALIRSCEAGEVLDVQVAENMGLGVRSALGPRDMANAIQSIAGRFDSPEAAAEHFGATRTWLNQATAAATSNLSPRISALLDTGKIAGAGTAIRLEKLSRKNEARAEHLIEQAALLPAGEKLSRKAVDGALIEAGGRRAPAAIVQEDPPWRVEAADSGINRGKVARVARILGLDEYDEAEVMARLIDEFLALKEPSL